MPHTVHMQFGVLQRPPNLRVTNRSGKRTVEIIIQSQKTEIVFFRDGNFLSLDNSVHGLNHVRFRPDSGLPDHRDFHGFSEEAAAVDTVDSNSGDFRSALRESTDQSCLSQADQGVPYGLATNAKRS